MHDIAVLMLPKRVNPWRAGTRLVLTLTLQLDTNLQAVKLSYPSRNTRYLEQSPDFKSQGIKKKKSKLCPVHL